MDENRIGWYFVRILQITKWQNIVKLKKDDGLDHDIDVKNKLPAQLGAFILSNSKRIMINFIREINGFFKQFLTVYTTETPVACMFRKIIGKFHIKHI